MGAPTNAPQPAATRESPHPAMPGGQMIGPQTEGEILGHSGATNTDLQVVNDEWMRRANLLAQLPAEDSIEADLNIKDILWLIHKQLEHVIARWMIPPKQTRREKYTFFNLIQTPVLTHGAKYVNFFCPTAQTIILDCQGVQATLMLQAGWQPQPFYVPDSSLISMTAATPAGGMTMVLEFRDTL